MSPDDDELLDDEPRATPVDERRSPTARPRRAPRQRSEAKIQRACQDVLTVEYEGYGIKHWGGSHSVAGTPDLLACLNGRSVVIEVKRPGERPTAVQLSQLRRWQDAGALAAWVTSEDELRAVLNRVDVPDWRADLSRPGAGDG